MREHPILFSTEMVKAILEGRKTMTRRIIKTQPVMVNGYYRWQPKAGYDINLEHLNINLTNKLCPCGQVGDRLWVRETWADGMNVPVPIIYKADKAWTDVKIKWRPSIFMPRWASRITLEITDIRVERVQEINNADAEQEGFALAGLQNGCPACDTIDHSYYGGRFHFAEYWDSLNAKRGYSWESNPWVWVVSFEVVNNANK